VATVTGFTCVDESGDPVPADAYGNNVAFHCLKCGAPVLAVVREHQRGAGPDNPSECRKCGTKFWVAFGVTPCQLLVHRLDEGPRTNGMLTGVIVGYDPGGNGVHGVAKLSVRGGQPYSLVTSTLQTAENVINYMEDMSDIVAFGVDTLTCWSTGRSAWRPADRWLRQHYVKVRNSIVSPNGLRGSMGLNGMAVLVALRLKFPSLPITETHPKVLYWYLSMQQYNYTSSKVLMDKTLAHVLGIDVDPKTDHEWDAALSTLAALQGVSGRWNHDLHSLPNEIGERIVSPCGRTNYYWPE
jgi:hypothetical protein